MLTMTLKDKSMPCS